MRPMTTRSGARAGRHVMALVVPLLATAVSLPTVIGPASASTGAVAPAHGQSRTNRSTEPARVAYPESIGEPTDAGSDGAMPSKVGSDGLSREVFGFLPYWELYDPSTVLDWRTLSTVAYFSVGCTPSGALAKWNSDGSATVGWAGWTSSNMTSVIDAAHRNHTRVVLTVSCFAWSGPGAAIQASLLARPAARALLARQVAAAVRSRGADGVNLDFEPILPGLADEFVKLVRRVRSELDRLGPGYQLTFDAMGSIGDQPIAEATAPGGADAVIVMGYDYRTDQAAVAGSIAPLSGPAYDLGDTIRAYTAIVHPSKVILGVPYYGRAWSTAGKDRNARNISGGTFGEPADPTYAQAADLAAIHGRRWDAVEKSPWTTYRRQICTPNGCVTTWRQTYFEDAASLKLRYDLVNRANLRGVAIWALGYDDDRPELRGALAAKFLTDRTPPLDPGTPATLAPGTFGRVVTDGLRIRSKPSISGRIWTTLAVGDALRIVGGPVIADGYQWFRIVGPIDQWRPVDGSAIEGWVAASGHGMTNLRPRSPVYATTIRRP